MKGKLHHVELYVKDLKVSKGFWQWLLTILGYEVYQTWDRGISFKLKDTYLVLVQTEEKYKEVPYHRCGAGLNHIAFHGGSEVFVDEIMGKLKEKGIRIFYEDQHPYAGGEGYYAVNFEDPDRIKVEIAV